MERRQFIRNSSSLALGAIILPNKELMMGKKLDFEISLAEFSYAGELYSGKMSNMDFPGLAKKDFGINVLEYVSGFFNNKHTDQTYLKELKQRTDDLGMKNNLIMVDGENIAHLDNTKRKQAVESHYAWVDAAKFLGCSMIRVNLVMLCRLCQVHQMILPLKQRKQLPMDTTNYWNMQLNRKWM